MVGLPDVRCPGNWPLTYPVVGVVAELGAQRAAVRSGGPRAGLLGMEPAAEEWNKRC